MVVYYRYSFYGSFLIFYLILMFMKINVSS